MGYTLPSGVVDPSGTWSTPSGVLRSLPLTLENYMFTVTLAFCYLVALSLGVLALR
jgi:hypothetical protein